MNRRQATLAYHDENEHTFLQNGLTQLSNLQDKDKVGKWELTLNLSLWMLEPSSFLLLQLVGHVLIM